MLGDPTLAVLTDVRTRQEEHDLRKRGNEGL